MAGLRRVHELCRRAGGVERRRDLGGHMAGFAHAGQNDPPLHGKHHLNGGHELAVERALQRLQAGAFGVQNVLRGLQDRIVMDPVRHRQVHHLGGGKVSIIGAGGPCFGLLTAHGRDTCFMEAMM